MKAILLLLLSVLLVNSLLYGQSFGISVGYGFLNMNDVNNDLNDHRDVVLYGFGFTSSPAEITGGLFLEGNFKYDIGIFNLGVTGNYISSSGNFRYSDVGFSIEENYDVSTVEILGLFEILIPVKNLLVQPFVQLAGGVGIASAERLYMFIHLAEQTSVEHTGAGNYFAGRIKGGVQFVLQNIILELAAGYRIANAGELKGTATGINMMPVRNTPIESRLNGNAIEFDYSGFILTGGISIVIQ